VGLQVVLGRQYQALLLGRRDAGAGAAVAGVATQAHFDEHQLPAVVADQVDFAYLGRYTNAAWLVIQAPGEARDGLFARNAEGHPLVLAAGGGLASAMEPDVEARIVGEATLPDGRRAVPVFQLIAERYLDPKYTPEAAAPICGIPAETIRRIAGEIAHTAFSEEIEIAVPWTDWAGRRHETMRGRPVGMHAMRGISAHSNGFQTCRALHLLQILLGTIDVPGGWRYKSPYPKPAPPGTAIGNRGFRSSTTTAARIACNA